jgi:hypothetical protein
MLAGAEDLMRVSGLAELHEQGGMTWTEGERGWVAMPDEVLKALAGGGFEECKRAVTTSRRDLRPAGGVWQGVNRTTGSVASAIWVARARRRRALVFIEIDGARIEMDVRRTDDASYRDQGGES